jgi:hypothetical protein
MRSLLTLGFGMLCALAAQAPAQAQTFISATGNDTNACTRAAPCRTLQRGVNATSPGRELTILTSGEYGPATVNKGLTVLAEGVSANIRQFTSGSTAIVVNAPGQKIALKGLFLTGGNSAYYGIRIAAAAAVHLDDIVVERFRVNGISMVSAGTELFVSNSTLRFNLGTGLYACCESSSSLTVDNSRFENNEDGLLASNFFGSITRSIASGNTGNGISVHEGSLNVTETTAANNGQRGFEVYAGQIRLNSSVARGNGTEGLYVWTAVASAILTNSVFTDNATGIFNAGTVFRRGNNTVTDNTTNFAGSGTTTFVSAY